jgi:hypothetical protein
MAQISLTDKEVAFLIIDVGIGYVPSEDDALCDEKGKMWEAIEDKLRSKTTQAKMQKYLDWLDESEVYDE